MRFSVYGLRPKNARFRVYCQKIRFGVLNGLGFTAKKLVFPHVLGFTTPKQNYGLQHIKLLFLWTLILLCTFWTGQKQPL